ncbi:MAG TPA: D-alanyl-D-alanine carboxypeptidase family protein [Actinomycetota bacterium]
MSRGAAGRSGRRLDRRLLIALAIVAALGLQAGLITLASAGPSGPPPTPVPPNGSKSPFPQALETPADPTERPQLDVAVALLVDLDDGQVLFAKAPELRRPIASLTKVMTAVIVLERLDLQDRVRVSPAAVFEPDDFGASSTLGLQAGERRTVEELLYALMLQSSNDAAVALAVAVSGSQERFVAAMNRRAMQLGMRSTEFFSPNGLDDRGRSTAHDLAIAVRTAYRTPGFAPIVATRFRTIPAPKGVKARHIQNRNALLWLYPDSIGVKTGSTAGAGYCLIGVAERDGRRLLAIVLGSPDEAFSDAATLLDYGFEAFTDRTFVVDGQDVGTVQIRGGAVEGVADGQLTASVPTDQIDRVRRRITVAKDASFPPEPGQRIGTLKLTLPGISLGSVPVVVRQVPPPPQAGDAPWWVRAAGAVGGGIVDVIGGLVGTD